MSRYRIKHAGNGFVAERRRWLVWQKLRTGLFWGVDDWYMPSPILYDSVSEAEDGIKSAIMQAGIRHAHQRVAKSLPPWTPKQPDALAEQGGT